MKVWIFLYVLLFIIYKCIFVTKKDIKIQIFYLKQLKTDYSASKRLKNFPCHKKEHKIVNYQNMTKEHNLGSFEKCLH